MMTSILLRRAAARASSTSPRSTHDNIPFMVALASSSCRRQVCTIATMNHNIMQGSIRHRRHAVAAAAAGNRYPRMDSLSASNIELVGQRHYHCHHQHQQYYQIQHQQKQTDINLHYRRHLASSLAHFSSSTSGSGDATNTSTTTTAASSTTTTDNKKVTTLSIIAKKRRNQKITMVTAYDYPSAVHVDRAGMDIVLVGDSCAMVELGFETTLVGYFVMHE